jgi:hypothetical protein
LALLSAPPRAALAAPRVFNRSLPSGVKDAAGGT